MSKQGVTGVLEVLAPEGIESFEWNGNPEDRARAREAFETRMRSGMYLATVGTTPGRSEQISSFAEAEQVEQEKGTVTVTISPALVGG